MTPQAAKELLVVWQEMNAKSYDAFCRLTTSEQQLLIKSLLDAQKLIGKPQKHWTEKAFVWQRWQILRSKYVVRDRNELT